MLLTQAVVRLKDNFVESAHNLLSLLIVLWLEHKDTAVAIFGQHSLVDLAPRSVFGCNIAIAHKLMVIIARLVDCVVDVYRAELSAQSLKKGDNIISLAVCVTDVESGVYILKRLYYRQHIVYSVAEATYKVLDTKSHTQLLCHRIHLLQ